MDKEPCTSKVPASPEPKRTAKRRIQRRTAELEKANESLKAEITHHRRTESELNLLLGIAQEMASSNDFLSSVEIALRRICQSAGWACGEAWIPSFDGMALQYSHAWYGESKSLEQFKQLSQHFRFARGVGLPGRVWLSNQGEWLPDLSAEPENKYPRYNIWKDFGFKSALAIPIVANDETVAVLVFFMSETREEDKRRIEVVSSVASQLGLTLQRKQAEQASREHKTLLQRIIDESSNIIWVKDREGRYQFINRTCEQIFGIPRKQVRGMTDYNLLPKDIADELRANDRKVVQAGLSMEFDETVPREGSAHTYVSNKFPIHDENGRVYAVCGIATDITQRKQGEHFLELRVEEKSAELIRVSKFNQAVMASMGEGLYTLDAQGLVTYINPAAEKLFRWSSAELLGRKMHDVTHYRHPDGSPFPAEECPGLQVLEKGRVLSNQEDVFIHKDGTFFDVVYSSAPLKSDDGEITGLVVVFRDISARKRTEKALHRSREELRALAARLQAAREEERTALAREIHDELSGTLTVLKMDLFLLSNQAAKDTDLFSKKLIAMSELIDRTLERVHGMITELRPIVLSTLGLPAAIEWQAGVFQQHSGIACETHVPDKDVRLDPQRSTAVFRIFQESLTNVARHAQASKVIVELKHEAQELILTVRDNGKGIDEAVIHARESIGLLGMRERAFSFGGSTEFIALPEGGTCVTVRVPLDPRDALSPAAPSNDPVENPALAPRDVT